MRANELGVLDKKSLSHVKFMSESPEERHASWQRGVVFMESLQKMIGQKNYPHTRG